jgi:3-oxoacyl-[acyl-carrier protein] reductase
MRKIILITGASRGMGALLAKHFAKSGFVVIANYLNSKHSIKKLENEIRNLGGEILTIKADVSSKKEVKKMVKIILKKYSRIDFLINNAGQASKFDDWKKINKKSFQEIINVNTYSVLNVTQEIAPLMKNGSILNISSVRGLLGAKDIVDYSVSKAGVINLTKSLAKILSPNIRVNCLVLGRMNLGMSAVRSKLDYRKFSKKNLMKRMGNFEDISQATDFLIGEKSSFITGQTIVVDGGASLIE